MKCNVSKELFEAMYNCDIATDKDILSAYKRLNLYIFFFDCKEWAMNKGFQIISGLSDEPAHRKQDEKTYAKVNYYSEDEIGNREYKDMYFMANTEIEAVIKASEYVLKEINERFKNK